jgi:hypothetical protein
MSDADVVPTPLAAAAPTPVTVVSTTPAARSGARWFWWIAGLSLVNIVLAQSGSDTNFVIGLMVKEWMPVAFHALALFFILNGAMSLRAALRSAGVR